MRKVSFFLAVYAMVLTSCSPQARTSAPLIPAGAPQQFQPLSPQVEPLVAHVVPFYSFGGGKEAGVGGGFGGLNADGSGNFFSASDAGGDPTCVTAFGPPSGCGFIYELTGSGSRYVQKILHVFVGPDGTYPQAYPILLNGSLYGTTVYGGRGTSCPVGCGTVYEMTPAKIGYRFRVIYNFTGKNGDGAYPEDKLAVDAQGNLFGTTSAGGGSFDVCPDEGGPAAAKGCGTVFKLTPTASGYRERVLYRFHGGTDGSIPYAGLVIQNGALIGTTKYTNSFTNCQSNPCGTVFELVPERDGSYRYVLIHRFVSGANDGSAASGLIEGPTGVLYGETRLGGPGNCTNVSPPTNQGCGVVYALTPTASGTYTESIVHRFINSVDGIYPGLRMVLYHGRLYGVTSGGGKVNKNVPICVELAGCGTLFSVKPSGADFLILHRFKALDDGAEPLQPLSVVNGTIYGKTLLAGQYGYGTAFKYTPR
jgi:uncharacterized repeat protein (TIGR03803 family)